ncbi:N-lysine methyltransferase METTL21A [Micractinium conductrix]|uniref:N-lysine methyltransferase METTL21A n=1 Tax=Micractinium conductrix TaxID=554055 RepID=A0A2P6VCL8_9CHLO|nr:N-lysine methyltransferase METTL21A [Micractinium conductrix]|eukprot:PSC71827.1 N-lysine methyltransferase METTL21A [Micractinium conductrix]
MQPAGALAEQPPQQPQQQTAQPLPQPVQPPPSMQRQQQQGEQQQQQQPLQQQPEHHQRQEPPGVSPATQALLSGEARGLESRRFEVAGVEVHIRQDLRGSNALRPLDDDRVWAGDAARGGDADAAAPPILTADDLSRVGLAVWQAGFVLADLLLRRPPFGSWHGVSALDLGCGTGLVGILLSLAGAEVTLTDQPHIVPLADANAQANLTPGLHRWRVVTYTWGQGNPAAALLQPPDGQQGSAAPAAAAAAAAAAATAAAAGQGVPGAPPPLQQPPPGALPLTAGSLPSRSYDVVTAADVVYQPEVYAELAATLAALAAPHTLVLLSYKQRGLQEGSLLSLLEAAGFAVQPVPDSSLAPEYQGGTYRVVRATRID